MLLNIEKNGEQDSKRSEEWFVYTRSFFQQSFAKCSSLVTDCFEQYVKNILSVRNATVDKDKVKITLVNRKVNLYILKVFKHNKLIQFLRPKMRK